MVFLKGRLIDYAHIESFNGSFRDKCLSAHWFMPLQDAKIEIET